MCTSGVRHRACQYLTKETKRKGWGSVTNITWRQWSSQSEDGELIWKVNFVSAARGTNIECVFMYWQRYVHREDQFRGKDNQKNASQTEDVRGKEGTVRSDTHFYLSNTSSNVNAKTILNAFSILALVTISLITSVCKSYLEARLFGLSWFGRLCPLTLSQVYRRRSASHFL